MPPTLPITDESPVERQGLESNQNSDSEPAEPMVMWPDSDHFHINVNVEGYQMMSSSEATALGQFWINSDVDDSDEEFEDDNVIEPADHVARFICQEEPPADTTSEMDPEHIEKIKAVMKNVILPSSNLPSWTAGVPEEEWKAVLLEKISSLSTDNEETSVEGCKHCSELVCSSSAINDANSGEEGIELTTQASCSKAADVETPVSSQSD